MRTTFTDVMRNLFGQPKLELDYNKAYAVMAKEIDQILEHLSEDQKKLGNILEELETFNFENQKVDDLELLDVLPNVVQEVYYDPPDKGGAPVAWETKYEVQADIPVVDLEQFFDSNGNLLSTNHFPTCDYIKLSANGTNRYFAHDPSDPQCRNDLERLRFISDIDKTVSQTRDIAKKLVTESSETAKEAQSVINNNKDKIKYSKMCDLARNYEMKIGDTQLFNREFLIQQKNGPIMVQNICIEILSCINKGENITPKKIEDIKTMMAKRYAVIGTPQEVSQYKQLIKDYYNDIERQVDRDITDTISKFNSLDKRVKGMTQKIRRKLNAVSHDVQAKVTEGEPVFYDSREPQEHQGVLHNLNSIREQFSSSVIEMQNVLDSPVVKKLKKHQLPERENTRWVEGLERKQQKHPLLLPIRSGGVYSWDKKDHHNIFSLPSLDRVYIYIDPVVLEKMEMKKFPDRISDGRVISRDSLHHSGFKIINDVPVAKFASQPNRLYPVQKFTDERGNILYIMNENSIVSHKHHEDIMSGRIAMHNIADCSEIPTKLSASLEEFPNVIERQVDGRGR